MEEAAQTRYQSSRQPDGPALPRRSGVPRRIAAGSQSHGQRVIYPGQPAASCAKHSAAAKLGNGTKLSVAPFGPVKIQPPSAAS